MNNRGNIRLVVHGLWGENEGLQPSRAVGSMLLAEPLLAKPTPVDRPPFALSAALLIGGIVAFTAVVSLTMLLLLPPSLASLGLIAYCFGCRHGVDADHIAAIDGVTRKLVAAGQRPLLVGLFFSIGHCIVVFVICGTVVASSSMTGAHLEAWESAGAAVGPWVAAAVLLCLGVLNVFVARDLLSQWRLREAKGHQHEIASMVGTCCPSLIAAIDRPWKVAGIGLLFGLGLDTATEIGLLTLSALAQPETPRASVLVLPLLFASGMALVDSLNGVLMAWAYEWAADNGPMHRLYFALFLTCASAALALLVSTAIALGQLATQLPPRLRAGPFWEAMRWLNDHFELLGLGSVVIFLVATAVAVALAQRCTPSQRQIEAEEKEKLNQVMREYASRPISEVTVRFE